MSAGELVLESLASVEALRHPWAWVHWWAVTTGILSQLEKYIDENRDTTHTGWRWYIRPAAMGGNRCFGVDRSERGWEKLEAFLSGLTSCLMIGWCVV